MHYLSHKMTCYHREKGVGTTSINIYVIHHEQEIHHKNAYFLHFHILLNKKMRNKRGDDNNF